VKLVVDEPDSDVARDLLARADLTMSSQVVYPEVRAAVAGIHRAGRIGSRRLRAAVEEIEKLYGGMQAIALDDPLARAAGDLAERYALRGYDAVHLASALAIDAPGELIVATWDAELAAAAVAEGRMVVPAQP
jgi:uncharacterized protein